MFNTTMDELGRVLIKREIRKQLGLGKGTKFSVSVEDGAVVLRKTEKTCAICKAEIDKDSEIPLCKECIDRVKASK